MLETKPDIRTVLQTNGIVRRKNLDMLKGFKVVHISYEPDDSTVRKIVGADIIRLALDLKDRGIYPYLFVTVHQGNINRIDTMVDTANSLGLDIGFNLCISTHESPELVLSPKQTIETSQKLLDLYLAKRILRFTSPLVAVIQDKQSDGYIGNRGGCTAGIATCSVTVDGDVIPCPFFRTVSAGNIHVQTLEDIWLGSPIFDSLRARNKFDEPCGSCKHLSYCGGCRKRALDSSGKLTGADPGCFLELCKV